MNDKKISIDPVQQILRTSGNSFHVKVAKYFRERDWTVRLGQYYVDAATDKAREIDLIVQRVLSHGRPYRNAVDVRVTLTVECKYVQGDTVFWFDAMDVVSATELIRSMAPFGYGGGTNIKNHHYLSRRTVAAKLFSSGKNASQGEERDPIFLALNQVLNGHVTARNMDIVDGTRGAQNECRLSYPLIVFSGFDRFHRSEMNGSDDVAAIKDSFLFEAHYAYRKENKQESEYMLVDMVAFDGLDDWLAKLYDEIKAVVLEYDLE